MKKQFNSNDNIYIYWKKRLVWKNPGWLLWGLITSWKNRDGKPQ